VSANGVELIEGGAEVSNGRLLFLPKLLFVDHERVEKLSEEYPWLEAAPLLPTPWLRSQFLSHAHKIISEREGFAYMAEYMEATPELGDFADTESSSDVYTLLVPRDDAFWRVLVQDATAPDPFLKDDAFRLRTLTGHLFKERYFQGNLTRGRVLTSADRREVAVTSDEGQLVTLNDGRQDVRVLGKEVVVYDLGTIFFVDRILFTETSNVVKVMEQFEGETLDDDDDQADVKVDEVERETEDFGKPALKKAPIFEEKGPKEKLKVEKVNVEVEKEGQVEVEEEAAPVEAAEKKASDDGQASLAAVDFREEDDWRSEDVEEKVIFVNNQRISLLTQRQKEE